MSNSNKNLDFLKVFILLFVIVLGFIYVNNIKKDIKYADFECPQCGSDEVLDLGDDIHGRQHYQCADCQIQMFDF